MIVSTQQIVEAPPLEYASRNTPRHKTVAPAVLMLLSGFGMMLFGAAFLASIHIVEHERFSPDLKTFLDGFLVVSTVGCFAVALNFFRIGIKWLRNMAQ